MASDDAALLAYMSLPLADRRAVARLLSPSKRSALREKLKERFEAERREKQCARNPGMLLSCSQALSKHLIAVASEAPGAAAVTKKARAAIRTAIEVRSAAP